MKTIFGILKLAMIAAIVHFFYWLFFTPPQNGNYENRGKTRTSEIFSLRTSTNIKGDFILGIGSIKGQDYYIFYRRTESGGLIREKIETENCILYEGHPKPFMMESGSIWYRLADGDTIRRTFARDEYNSLVTLYIPKGTITERTNIDIN